MIYLVVGVDRHTSAQWHENVMATDVTSATLIARARAAERGIEPIIAAVIGTYSTVVAPPADEPPADRRAA